MGRLDCRKAKMSETVSIDVRTIPPMDRHRLIFECFDNLAVGAVLELTNDHDPRPLHYQLDAQRGGMFDWAYAEQGPDRWRVRISKITAKPRDQGSCCGTCG